MKLRFSHCTTPAVPGGTLSRTILWAMADGNELLATAGGTPVLPVRAAGELPLLRAAAKLFGGSLVEAKEFSAVDHVERAPSGAGLVFAADQSVASEARLYAHLTGRGVATSTELGLESPEVAVCLGEHLSDLLFRYWDPPVQGIVGIIAAQTRHALRLQVLLKSVAANLSTSVSPGRPARVLAPVFEPAADAESRAEYVRTVKEILNAGLSVLTISTHSDGIDSMLGMGMTLCGLSAMDAGPGPLPRCVATGHCHRSGLSLDDPELARRVVHPNHIAARVLFEDACSSVPLANSPVNAQWSLLWGLLENPAIGALIVNWEAALTSLDWGTRLTHRLASGSTIGEAMQSHLDTSTPRRICLFGDPRVRSNPPDSLVHALPAAPSMKNPEFGGLPLLRAISLTLSSDRMESVSQAAYHLREQIEVAEVGLLQGHEPTPESSGGVREAVQQLVKSQDGALYDVMISLSEVERSGDGVCACGLSLSVYRCTPRVAGALKRRLSICPQCGIIEDVPQWFPEIRLETTESTVKVVGNVTALARFERITLFSGKGQTNWSQEWPRHADGSSQTEFSLPPEFPGQLKVRAFLSSTFDYAMLGTLLVGREHRVQSMLSRVYLDSSKREL